MKYPGVILIGCETLNCFYCKKANPDLFVTKRKESSPRLICISCYHENKSFFQHFECNFCEMNRWFNRSLWLCGVHYQEALARKAAER